jgi:hypothetical protein
MRLNEERELKQSLVGFSLLKRFSPKTCFSPSLVRGAWNFSLSDRLILVRLNLVPWIQAPPKPDSGRYAMCQHLALRQELGQMLVFGRILLQQKLSSQFEDGTVRCSLRT